MRGLFHPISVFTLLLAAIIVPVLCTNNAQTDDSDVTKQTIPPRSSSLPDDNPSFGSIVDDVKKQDVIDELSRWRQSFGMAAFFDADDYRPAATKMINAILNGKTIDDSMTGGRVSYLEIHRSTVLGNKRLTPDRVRKYVNLLPRLVVTQGSREMERGVYFTSIGMWAFASNDDAATDKITVMLASRNDIIAIVVVFSLTKPSEEELTHNQKTQVPKVIEWTLTSCGKQYGSESICKVPEGDDKTTVKRNKYADADDNSHFILDNWLFFTCVVQTMGTRSSKALVSPDLRTYGIGFDYPKRIISENNLEDAILNRACGHLSSSEKRKLSGMFKSDALKLITKPNDAFKVPDALKDKLTTADKNIGCFIY